MRARESEVNKQLNIKDFITKNAFLEQINSFLSLIDNHFEDVIPWFIGNKMPEIGYPDVHFQFVNDFKHILQIWDDEHSEVFNKSSSWFNGQSKPLMGLLNSVSMADTKNNNKSSTQANWMITSFINQVNDQSLHLYEIRLLFLEYLVTNKNEHCSLIEDEWSQELIDLVKQFFNVSEPHLFNRCKNILIQDNNISSYLKGLEMSESYFELSLDSYLGYLNDNTANNFSSLSKSAQNELNSKKMFTYSQVNRWRIQANDYLSTLRNEIKNNDNDSSIISKLELRNKWCGIIFDQFEQSTSQESITSSLQDLKESLDIDIKNSSGTIEIPFLNFKNIPRLDINGVDNQISKMKAVNIFSKVLGKINNLENGEINEKILILENILNPPPSKNNKPLPQEHEAIIQFINTSNMDFKINLCQTLLNCYKSINDDNRSLIGALIILKFLNGTYTSSSYEAQSGNQRELFIVRVLQFYYDLSEYILHLILENRSILYDLTKSQRNSGLTDILQINRLLFVFVLFDDDSLANLLHPSTAVSFESCKKKMKDMVVRTWSLTYLFFESSLVKQQRRPEIINDFLSIVHEHLGSQHYCSFSDGVFLQLSQEELINLNWKDSETDILQGLYCRFNISLSTDKFTPYNHHSEPGHLDRKSVIQLTPFLNNFSFSQRKKKAMLPPQKADIKVALDQFYDVIGAPPENDDTIIRNLGVIDTYLDSLITTRGLREAYSGVLSLSFDRTNLDSQVVADEGLYYIQGLIALSLFRSRKRTLPGRIDELEHAIKLFRYDIVYNTGRIESWIGLGEAYSYLAEDDMIWSAEKFNSDRKKGIAIYQKKATLCFMMATSQLIQCHDEKSDYYKSLGSILWPAFGKELYGSALNPMNMLCYELRPTKLFCGPEGIYEEKVKATVKKKTILGLMVFTLKLAVLEAPHDWTNYYYLASSLYKNDGSPQNVIRYLIQSINVSDERTGSHLENIFEPHYKLCSKLYKYVRNGKLSGKQALEYLESSKYFHKEFSELDSSYSNEEIESKARFYQSCLKTLQKIKSTDKKKWQHRPSFLIAKIYDEVYNDVTYAKEELLSLFSLKSTSKNVLNIWKPDYERPGKHFVYVYDYIKFLVVLLKKTDDLSLLLTLFKKLRRFQTGVINHNELWEFACDVACDMFRTRAFIPNNYTDIELPKLVYSEFTGISDRIKICYEQKESVLDKNGYLSLLYDVSELRRINNGVGTTARLDDVFVAVYLKFCNAFREEEKASGIVIYDTNTVNETNIQSISTSIASPIPTATTTPLKFVNYTSTDAAQITPGKSGLQASLLGSNLPQDRLSPHTHSPIAKTKVAKRDIIPRAIAILKFVSPTIQAAQKAAELEKTESPKVTSTPSFGNEDIIEKMDIDTEKTEIDTEIDVDPKDEDDSVLIIDESDDDVIIVGIEDMKTSFGSVIKNDPEAQTDED